MDTCDQSLQPGTDFRGIDGVDDDFARRNRLGGVEPPVWAPRPPPALAGTPRDALPDAAFADMAVGQVNRVLRESTVTNRLAFRAAGPTIWPPLFRRPAHGVVPIIEDPRFDGVDSFSAPEAEGDMRLFRNVIEQWALVTDGIAFRPRAWFPGDPAAPYPMIRKWSDEVAFVATNAHLRYWMPAAVPNFEHTFIGHYVGLRVAWGLSPTNTPALVREIFTNFYGEASESMRLYWHFVDQAWLIDPDASGGAYVHVRRWPRGSRDFGSFLIERASAEARTPEVKYRVEMARRNWMLFDAFMRMREGLAEGRWAGLDDDSEAYLSQVRELARRSREALAFGGDPESWYEREFDRRYRATFTAAALLARDYRFLTPRPIRIWKARFDGRNESGTDGWAGPDVPDGDWVETDTCMDTWGTLGHGGDLGVMWYRTRVVLPALPPKPDSARFWIGATDGTTRLFINGTPCPALLRDGRTAPEHAGFSQPATFDVSKALVAGTNVVAVRCERTDLNELGTGGILGAPCALYVAP
jgi:hypothetical protein